ncbi:MAG: addiction module protein [Bacteroidia bacterium]|nr:addiction module protein [Bacteroidia bacterium]
MEKEQLEKLSKLSRREKIKIVQFLWDNIAKEQNEMSFPAEHQRIINERLEKIRSGNGKFKTWNEIIIKYKSV